MAGPLHHRLGGRGVPSDPRHPSISSRREIDSYSAFFENDHTTPTGLEGYLRTRGVDTVTLVGLATDYCVNFSAVDAAKLGFKVRVVESLCRAIDLDGSLAAAKEGMAEAGVAFS